MAAAIVAAAAAVSVLIAGCGSSTSAGSGTGTSVGTPKSGGTATVIETAEPTSLDPAVMTNAWAFQTTVGNALYGSLVTDDATTGKLTYGLAQSLTTSDNGTTWIMKLRPGVKFSDGTPFTAASVKYDWDRLKSPSLGSQSIFVALEVASTTAVNATTFKFTLVSPNPNFAYAITQTSLDWIASEAALSKGTAAFDADPVGAGPFVLKSWNQGGAVDLVRNPKYWDAPLPYLNALNVEFNGDDSSKVNAVTTGAAQITTNVAEFNAQQSKSSGLQVFNETLNGGINVTYGCNSAPFNNPEAREAVNEALNPQLLDSSILNGAGQVPDHLFQASSPFYTPTTVTQYNKAAAQALFNKLALAGTPVNFTITTFPTAFSTSVADAVQSQLSQYKNVTVKVAVLNTATAVGKLVGHTFQAIVSGVNFADPEPELFEALATQGPTNYGLFSDPTTNAALLKARLTTNASIRKTEYAIVAKQVAALNPFFLAAPAYLAVVASSNVHGLNYYGQGSLDPAAIWLS